MSTYHDTPEEMVEAILDELPKRAREHADASLSPRLERFSERAALYRAILAELTSSLESLQEAPKGRAAPWVRVANAAQALLEWVDTLPEGVPKRELGKGDPAGPWRAHMKSRVRGFKEPSELPVPATVWEPHDDDPVLVSLWRRAFGRAHRRHDAEGAPVAPPATRSLSIRSFLVVFATIPVARVMVTTAARLEQHLARQLASWHDEFEKILDALDGMQGALPHNAPDPAPVAAAVRAHLQLVDDHLETLPATRQELLDALEAEVASTCDHARLLWPDAGTYALPGGRFDGDAAFTLDDAVYRRLATAMQGWRAHVQGEASDWRRDLELASLQVTVLQRLESTLTIVGTRVGEGLLPSFEAAQVAVDGAIARFEEATAVEGLGRTETRRAIVQAYTTILKELRQERIPAIVTAVNGARLPTLLDGYLFGIRSAVGAIPVTQVILTQRDLETHPPAPRTDAIPLKYLIEHHAFGTLGERFKAFGTRVRESERRILRRITDLDHVVEFNLGAGIGAMGEDKTDGATTAVEIVKDGLVRVRGILGELIEGVQTIAKSTEEELPAMTVAFLEHVEGLRDNDEVVGLKMAVARERTRQGAAHVRSWAKATLRRVQRGLRGKVTTVAKGVGSAYSRIEEATGIGKRRQDAAMELANELIEVRERIQRLPYVYQRLFKLEALKDERFFFGREEEMAAIQQELASWKAGTAASLAIVGEKGSGRTTLLTIAVQSMFADVQVTRIPTDGVTTHLDAGLRLLADALGASEATSFAELEAALTTGPRRVVVVENLHNLFLRVIDGFELLEQLLLLITATQGTVFWLCSCTRYSWRYLDKVVDIGSSFRRVVHVRPLDGATVKRLVQQRHAMSGFGLQFQAPPGVAGDKTYRALQTDDERQAWLATSFFDRLATVSDGNTFVALVRWLATVVYDGGDAFTVPPLVDLDASFLSQLSADELLTMAMLVQHERLSSEHHAAIFRQPLLRSKRLLGGLRNRGLLVMEGPLYAVHPFLYRSVVTHLKHRTMLQ